MPGNCRFASCIMVSLAHASTTMVCHAASIHGCSVWTACGAHLANLAFTIMTVSPFRGLGWTPSILDFNRTAVEGARHLVVSGQGDGLRPFSDGGRVSKVSRQLAWDRLGNMTGALRMPMDSRC